MRNGRQAQQIQSQFLGKVMADSASQEAQRLQAQSLMQSLHMHAIKDIYVRLTCDEIQRRRSDGDLETVLLDDPAFFDKVASEARLAGDRLMISLGAMKEPGAE